MDTNNNAIKNFLDNARNVNYDEKEYHKLFESFADKNLREMKDTGTVIGFAVETAKASLNAVIGMSVSTDISIKLLKALCDEILKFDIDGYGVLFDDVKKTVKVLYDELGKLMKDTKRSMVKLGSSNTQHASWIKFLEGLSDTLRVMHSNDWNVLSNELKRKAKEDLGKSISDDIITKYLFILAEKIQQKNSCATNKLENLRNKLNADHADELNKTKEEYEGKVKSAKDAVRNELTDEYKSIISNKKPCS